MVGLEWRATALKYCRFAARTVADLVLESSAGARVEEGLHTYLDSPLRRYADVGHAELFTGEPFEPQVRRPFQYLPSSASGQVLIRPPHLISNGSYLPLLEGERVKV
jgi:hypothetical protein